MQRIIDTPRQIPGLQGFCRRESMQKEELTKEELAQLLREAEQAHAAYESTLGHRDEDWPTWYAAFIINRLRGTGGTQSTPSQIVC